MSGGFSEYFLYETVIIVMMNLEACSKQVINKNMLSNNENNMNMYWQNSSKFLVYFWKRLYT